MSDETATPAVRPTSGAATGERRCTTDAAGTLAARGDATGSTPRERATRSASCDTDGVARRATSELDGRAVAARPAVVAAAGDVDALGTDLVSGLNTAAGPAIAVLGSEADVVDVVDGVD